MADNKTYYYKVTMTCGGCSGAVTKRLNKLKTEDARVEDFNVDLDTQHVTVTAKPGEELDGEKIAAWIAVTGKKTEHTDENWQPIKKEDDAEAAKQD